MCLSATFPSNQPLDGLKDLLTAAEKPHYSLAKPLTSYFVVYLFHFFPIEQQCGKRRACGEIRRADYMYVLTCKSTPALVKDGSYSLFPLDGRRAWTAPCSGLSHGYWVSQLKLCALQSHGNPVSIFLFCPPGLKTCRPLKMTQRNFHRLRNFKSYFNHSFT